MGLLLRLLLVCDTQDNGQFIIENLQQAGYRLLTEQVATVRDVESALDAKPWDLLISTYSTRALDPTQLLQILQSRSCDIPLIVIADDADEPTAVEAMYAGVQDYLSKHNLARLGPVVGRAIRESEYRARHHATEIALHESEQRFQRMVETTQEGIWITDRNKRISFANDKIAQLLGYTAEEMIGASPLDFAFESDHAVVAARLARRQMGISEQFETRMRCKDGSPRWVLTNASPLFDEHGNYLGGMAMVADITERARLQAILDSMGEGVIFISHDTGEITYTNQAFSEISGYTAQTDPLQLFDDIPGATFERVIKHDDGSSSEVALTMTEVLDRAGRLLGKVALMRDIKQEKALQAQKDRIIASAAHELRNPAASLKMRLYLLRQQPEKLEEHLNAIEKTVDRLNDLLDSLLDLSRLERGMITLERQPVRLDELVHAIANEHRLRAAEKSITLSTEGPDAPIRANLDHNRFHQVLDNLILNAVNYTREGGSITVRVSMKSNTSAQIQIADTGIGIAEDKLPNIFEPFFRGATNRVKGNGLGLSIASEIIALHGGTISVESVVGEGSVFTIEFPLDE